MSNGYTNLIPNITIESTSFFSASFAASRVSPVSALLLSGVDADKFDLTVDISCTNKDKELFSFKKSYHGLTSGMFDSEDKGRLLIRFAFRDFNIDYKYLSELDSAVTTDIVSKITVNGTSYEVRNPVTVFARNEFAGIECHPETLAAFTSPMSQNVKEIASGCSLCDEWTTLKEAYENVGSIIKNIRAKNIICVKRDGYSPEKKQEITPAGMLTGKSSVVATPLELAVLFCSAAEACGLDTVVVFVKNTMGIVSVFCGVNVRKDMSFITSESMTKIRRAIDDGDMFVFDPGVLSSAQTVDAEHASFLASEILHKSGTDMILSVGIGKCLREIIGIDGVKKECTDARSVLGDIYSGVSVRRAFKLFGGDYGSYDVVPFVGFEEENFYGAYENPVTFKPMEISEKLSDFRDISDNFGAFAFSGLKKKEYNKNEMMAVVSLFKEFKSRIESKKYVVSGLYENVFHEKVSRMCYGSVPGMKNYLTAGFLRMTDAKNAETVYLPLCFAEADIDCDYDYRFRLSDKPIIVNTVVASFFECQESEVNSADTLEKVYALFEEAASRAVRKGDYSEAVLLKEFALIKADISEVVLWNDIRRNGKKMLANENFADVLAEKQIVSEQAPENSFVLPRFVPEQFEKTVFEDNNVVVSGKSVKEKSDLAVNKAVYNVSQGKKTLVVSDCKDFNDEIYGQLKKEGFSELMFRLDGNMTTLGLIEALKKRIAEVVENPGNPGGAVSADYDMISQRLKAYSGALSTQDSVLGISVPDGILSFYRASETEDGKTVPVLPVADNAFSNMTQHKFNVLFDRAEKLIETAGAALKASGLYISLPLKSHPLYPVKNECHIPEEQFGSLFDMISRINGVISDYRDTFFDVSEYMGIELSDIKDIKGLHALNELYLLVISARELEIPDDVTGIEMTDFAAGANKLKNDLGRAENIEYRLRFFSKEIFEDVDTLLSGYSPSEAGHGNFIKKYLVKKNNKDVLLQYVPDERRNDFNQHSVEDIYFLLEEYRKIKASTSITDSYLGKENSVKLAEMIKNAEALLGEIYPGILGEEKKLADKIGKICDFVKLVSNDTSLSKKLTYARAKFAQVYSKNDCLTATLEKALNASFDELTFDSGILGYDGLSMYLKELERNIPSMDVWNNWLAAKNAADEFMPEFSKYIEEKGIKENADRVFASSLILPSVGYLIKKYDIIKHKKNFENARAKYPEFYEKAKKLASVNAIISYKQRLKHFAETENLSSMDDDASLSLKSFVNKYKKTVLTVFPVIFADAYGVGSMFSNDAAADTVIAGCFENTECILLTSLASASRMFLIKYTENGGILSDKLAKSGALCMDVSYALYHECRELGALNGVKDFYGYTENAPEFAVINVNGTMRRVSDSANAQEAESCSSKAAEIYSKLGKSVGIFAATHGQAAYIKHLINLNCESDKKLAEGVEQGFIKVYEPSKVCFEDHDYALVSLGAAVDKNGSIGWSFGCAGPECAFDALGGAFNCAREKIFVICSLNVKEATRLRATGFEAEKLYFTILSASKGVCVMDAVAENEEATDVSALVFKLGESIVSPAGRFKTSAEGYDTKEKTFYMFECDAHGLVRDRIVCEMLMKEKGCHIVNVSVLDGILDVLGLSFED